MGRDCRSVTILVLVEDGVRFGCSGLGCGDVILSVFEAAFVGGGGGCDATRWHGAHLGLCRDFQLDAITASAIASQAGYDRSISHGVGAL